MGLKLTPDVTAGRDSKGHITRLRHARRPSEGLESLTAVDRTMSARKLAERYIADIADHYALEPEMTASMDLTPGLEVVAAPDQLRFLEEKRVLGNVSVAFAQTRYGIPVWNSGVNVQILSEEMQVVASGSRLTRDVELSMPSADLPYVPNRVDKAALSIALGLSPDESDSLTLDSVRPFVYRYDESAREFAPPEEGEDGKTGFETAFPRLPLPSVPDGIVDGRDYLVSEALFTYQASDGPPLNWSALIDWESGAVLYIRPLVSCANGGAATGLVYTVDPTSKSGDPTDVPTASQQRLDSFRDDANLRGLVAPEAGQDQALKGEYVEMVNITDPPEPAPTSPAPGDFDYPVPTNDFSAVNAYYNCDRLFHLLDEMGFDVRDYFDGTTFPVRVDHRCTFQYQSGPESNTVNAQAPGNISRTGSDGFRFALAAVDTLVGIAADWRVVLHEFGHALLWDNVHWPNFRFAHSAGDSLAAILNDPGNQADRMETFPWVLIERRHDRTPEQEWAWGGPKYDPFNRWGPDRAGYLAEQMLSSTMFRIYLAAGGGSGEIEVQRFASWYVCFLIIKSIGLLSPVNNAEDPEDYADTLMIADTGTMRYQGQEYPCGVLEKVIRWGFEKQGAYQPPGTVGNVLTAGAPPEIDVFIDDVNAGEYEYVDDPFSTAAVPGIWVRNAADDVEEDQPPQVGSQNFVYVRVKNRGAQATTAAVFVRAFRSSVTPAEASWPTDWEELDPAEINAGAVPADGSVVTGPFSWAPASADESVMVVVDTAGDPSNADKFTADNAIPVRRLVPVDNNIGLRTFGA